MRAPIVLISLSLVLAGCDKKPTASAPPPTATATPPPSGSMPNFKPEDKPAAAPTPPAAAPPPAEPAAKDAAWVAWTHPDKLISVKFPGTPQQSENEAPSAIGPVKFIMAMHAAETRAFMAGATVYKVPEGTPFDISKALEAGKTQMLANIKATATAEKPIKLDGLDGSEVEFETTGPNGQKIHGIARIFASADPPAGYFAGAFRMTETPDPDFQTFLDSVHLGKGVQ